MYLSNDYIYNYGDKHTCIYDMRYKSVFIPTAAQRRAHCDHDRSAAAAAIIPSRSLRNVMVAAAAGALQIADTRIISYLCYTHEHTYTDTCTRRNDEVIILQARCAARIIVNITFVIVYMSVIYKLYVYIIIMHLPTVAWPGWRWISLLVIYQSLFSILSTS